MRFHGILVVRDEGDFIAESMAHVLSWCDTLHILDTGSTDGTWEIMQELASEDRRIVTLERFPTFFRDELRPYLFDRVRGHCEQGDWIARLDADEVHHVPPPEFVRARLRRYEGRVFAQMYEFILRRSEAEGADDPTLPIVERRRWYYVDPYPELRLFRYRRGMQWPEDHWEPYEPGVMARARIPIRHYRRRTASQLQRRCLLRSRMMAAGNLYTFEHWLPSTEEWEYWVWEDGDTRMKYWAPGTELPEVHDESHLYHSAHGRPARFIGRVVEKVAGPRGIRALEVAIHSTPLIRARDARRPRWTGWEPRPIPEEVQRELASLTPRG